MTEPTLAQTIIATMRTLGPAPESQRPEILVNVKDLEAVIEEHLDEWLARDRDETPPPSTHVAGWNDPATAPKDGTVLHLLVRPGQEELDPLTSFHDSRAPYETIGFNHLKDTLEDVWQFAGWDWCHDCITDGDGEVIGWRPFGVNAALAATEGSGG